MPLRSQGLLFQDHLPFVRNYIGSDDPISCDMVNDLSGHTDCCGSECKLFHLGSCLLNSTDWLRPCR